MKPGPRALLLELIRRYNGGNNGWIGLSQADATDALALNDRAAVRSYFAELVEKGFIRCAKRGGFNVKVRGVRQASEWLLTWLPDDRNNVPPDKPFMRRQQNSRDGIPAKVRKDFCHNVARTGQGGVGFPPQQRQTGHPRGAGNLPTSRSPGESAGKG